MEEYHKEDIKLPYELKEAPKIEKGLRKIYESKKKSKNPSKELEKIVKEVFFKQLHVGDADMFADLIGEHLIFSEAGEKYGIGIVNISVDEYRGQAGLTYKIGYAVVDLEEKKAIHQFGPISYKDGKSGESDWSLRFDEAKILEEKIDGVVIGLKSNEKLQILEFKKDGGVKVLEDYCLVGETYLKITENAIKELDASSLEHYFEKECHSKCTFLGEKEVNVKKVSDNYALVRVDFREKVSGNINDYSLFLIIKNMGIVELEETCMNFWYNARQIQFGKDGVDDIRIEYTKGGIRIRGTITRKGSCNSLTNALEDSWKEGTHREIDYKINLT